MTYGQMKPVAASAKIDFTDWYFDAPVPEDTRKVIADVLVEVFRNDPPAIDLPYQYWPRSDGRKRRPPDDPAMLYLELPLANSEADKTTWECSLEDVLDNIIDFHCSHDRKIHGLEGIHVCQAIAARLRELAAKLDATYVVPELPLGG